MNKKSKEQTTTKKEKDAHTTYKRLSESYKKYEAENKLSYNENSER
jgi:hypothetical protein